MEKRYINEKRYKKSGSRKRRTTSTVKNNLKPSKKVEIKDKKIEKKVVKKNTKQRVKQRKLNNIVICIILIILIAIISRAILKDENEPFIPLPFWYNENDEVINIGIISTDDLLDANTNNVILSELNKYSKDMLLVINEDYSITYKCVSEVHKMSNKEYVLLKNKDSKVTTDKIKTTLEQYLKNSNSLYYNKLKNIDSITVVDSEKVNIKLKTDDPYFVYNLDISLDTSYNMNNYVQDDKSSSNRLVYNRHKKAYKELPAKITVTKYNDVYDLLEAYKSQEINMFVTGSENIENILGRYEYNIKSYRNGESLFLFGNEKSEIFSKIEVRQAVAYSINRDGIITDVLESKGTKIDLPYIYDNVKYKYDVYAAENLLLSNGYTKTNKVYSKKENGEKITLELELIVNKDDEIKVSVANKIKNNLSAVGIKVNVEKLSDAKLESRIKAGTYDLLLANVNLNNNPNITFLQDNLYITEEIRTIIESINKAKSISELQVGIKSLKEAMSNNISVIGIYSNISYLIYSKDIIGINEITNMNLFKDLLYINEQTSK